MRVVPVADLPLCFAVERDRKPMIDSLPLNLFDCFGAIHARLQKIWSRPREATGSVMSGSSGAEIAQLLQIVEPNRPRLRFRPRRGVDIFPTSGLNLFLFYPLLRGMHPTIRTSGLIISDQRQGKLPNIHPRRAVVETYHLIWRWQYPLYIFSGVGIPKRVRPFSIVVTNARTSASLCASFSAPKIRSRA